MTREEYFEGLKDILAGNKLHIEKYTSLTSQIFKGDLIYHFYIREIPKWNFGLLFRYDNQSTKNDVVCVEFFAQHNDKNVVFSPHWSELSISDEFSTSDPDIDIYDMGTTFDIIGLCRLIKYYPVLSYLMDYYGWHAYDYFGAGRLWRYLRLRTKAIIERCKNRLAGGANK